MKPPYGRRTWRKGDGEPPLCSPRSCSALLITVSWYACAAVPKGLIDGIVRVTMDRLEAATSVCETYSTVKYTDFDKNMASISVIVRPIGECARRLLPSPLGPCNHHSM